MAFPGNETTKVLIIKGIEIHKQTKPFKYMNIFIANYTNNVFCAMKVQKHNYISTIILGFFIKIITTKNCSLDKCSFFYSTMPQFHP